MSKDHTQNTASLPPHVRQLKGMLAERGLRQNDVADWLGISQAAVSRRMSGEVDFRWAELSVIAQRLGVPELGRVA